MPVSDPSSAETAPWAALRRHHRPHAHWYATRVLGVAPGEDCDELIDAAFDTAFGRVGRRHRSAEPPGLPEVRDRLQLAIRTEVWRRQHRVRWALRRLLTGRARRSPRAPRPTRLVTPHPSS